MPVPWTGAHEARGGRIAGLGVHVVAVAVDDVTQRSTLALVA